MRNYKTSPAVLFILQRASLLSIAQWKRFNLAVVIIQSLSLLFDVDFTAGEVHEYCNMEVFRPRCRQGEAIVMETALFGRMRVGRCIVNNAYLTSMLQFDPTSLGCSADVLSYTDRICSGRQSCDISVPNPELDNFNSCGAELKKHLEASYYCVGGKLAFNSHGSTRFQLSWSSDSTVVVRRRTHASIEISKSVSKQVSK